MSLASLYTVIRRSTLRGAGKAASALTNVSMSEGHPWAFRSAVDRTTDYLTGWGFFHKYSSSFYAILPHFLWRCILPVHWLWPVWQPKCLYWSELLAISGSLYTYRDCRPSIHRILRYTANIWTHHHTNSSLYYFSCHTPLQSHCRWSTWCRNWGKESNSLVCKYSDSCLVWNLDWRSVHTARKETVALHITENLSNAACASSPLNK